VRSSAWIPVADTVAYQEFPDRANAARPPLPAAISVDNTAMKSMVKVEATTRIELVYTVLQTVA
jgi:hypothetical protein